MLPASLPWIPRRYSVQLAVSRQEIPTMVATRAEAVRHLKGAGGLKLVVLGADGH